MSLLSRRIFFECTKVFFISLVVLMVFVIMGRALQLKETLFGLDISFWDTMAVFGFLSPTFIILMAPVSVMIAVFLTFLRMGVDRELVAAKAGGVSLYQLLPAPILFTCLCTLGTLWISYSLISWGAINFRTLLLDIAENRVSIALQAGTFNQDIPGMVFFARQVDPEKGTLGHIMIEDSSRENTNLTIIAPRGNLDVDHASGELLVLLQDGIIYTTQEGGLTQLSFEEYVVRFSLSSLVKGLDFGILQPKEMHWNELEILLSNNYLQDFPLVIQKIKAEQHKRILLPVSCIVLTLFAICIAASFQGMHRQVGLLFALGVLFVYYSMISFGMNFVEYNGVNPYLGIWLPVTLFLMLGMYGVRIAANERMPSILELIYVLKKIFLKKSIKVNA